MGDIDSKTLANGCSHYADVIDAVVNDDRLNHVRLLRAAQHLREAAERIIQLEEPNHA